jgi:hypothetical protein
MPFMRYEWTFTINLEIGYAEWTAVEAVKPVHAASAAASAANVLPHLIWK